MSKPILSKIISYLPQILALLFIAGFAVYAWTEPSSAPPLDNVATPLNVSSAEQIKTGNLVVNALGVSAASGNALIIASGGNLCLGASCRNSWPSYNYPPNSCSAGSSIRAISSDGTVTCEPDDDTKTLVCANRTGVVGSTCDTVCAPVGEVCTSVSARVYSSQWMLYIPGCATIDWGDATNNPLLICRCCKIQ